MSKFQLLCCFTILVAYLTFSDIASAHVKIQLALPQVEDPQMVKDVESYIAKVVTIFVINLEKECPKTEKFKGFFEKLKVYSKYVCPISKARGYKSDMKAKIDSLFQDMSALGLVNSNSRGKSVKTEAMDTIKLLQSIGEKIAGGQNNKIETNGSMKLTVEQQKEIKDGILKWLQVITRIAKTTEEISSKSSTKTQTKRSSRVLFDDDLSKLARNSAKEFGNNGNKRSQGSSNSSIYEN